MRLLWTPAVLSVLYACVLYFCICTCSAQLSMFHMERRSRNTLIIIIICFLLPGVAENRKGRELKRIGCTLPDAIISLGSHFAFLFLFLYG